MKQAHSNDRSAFTLIELLVVIAIIALLISIVLPSMKNAREAAKHVRCMSSLKEAGFTNNLYAHDNRDYLPGERGMGIRLTDGLLYRFKYSTVLEVWGCPNDKRTKNVFRSRPYSYTLNGRSGHFPGKTAPIDHYKISKFKRPYRTILLGEENTDVNVWPWVNDARFIYVDFSEARHFDKSQVYMVDGSAGDIPGNIMIWSHPDYLP